MIYEKSAGRDALAGNTDTSLLKIVAFVSMLIDHLGASMFGAYQEMRVLGRIAMPLYAWCLVVGCVKTRDPLRYGLRLLALAIISQPFNMMALNHTWSEFNILFLLVLGLVAIEGIRQRFMLSQIWAPALCYLALGFVNINYGWRGLTFIILLYIARGSVSGIVAACMGYFFFWGSSSAAVNGMFGVSFSFLAWPGLGQLLSPLFKLQAMSWLALPLIAIPTRSNIRLPKWLGYALYPAHLLIIAILRLTVQGVPLERLFAGFGVY